MMTDETLNALYESLGNKGTFDFDVYPTGMFPAVGKGSPTESTSGYRAAWIRDNVHVAYAHYVCGDKQRALGCVTAILNLYLSHSQWFTANIKRQQRPRDPMKRPHIRFDGIEGNVIEQKWPHDQNDALGAFMWLLCLLLRDGAIKITPKISELLMLMVRYFETIRYWEDEDSGHWEETRKISASSIGTVNAGLKQCLNISKLFADLGQEGAFTLKIEKILHKGMNAMNAILPWESIQSGAKKKRRYDAALLFLVDPYDIVESDMAKQIVDDVATHLQGDIGIRRYLLDSYWGPNYRTVPPERRTVDLSDGIICRDDYAVSGQEAQWCIFDSVISIYFGRLYRRCLAPCYFKRQVEYFNRAVSQLYESSSGRRTLLPEAYFVENGRYVPNDHMPLQWAQANLWRAFHAMRVSVRG